MFPDQVACAENLVGEREVPIIRWSRQTIADCLNEAMDIDGLERLLPALESGEIASSRATSPSRRRWRSRCCPPGPTPISTMRRSRSAARRR